MYSSTLGYYGKLPLSAEFIRCRASGAEIDELDRWIREGMFHAKSTLGPAWSMDFLKGDQWAFLYVPLDRSRFLAGLLKPSQDKAGREFPFLIYLLLERTEFHEIPWCAPMHFREFFVQSHRLLEDVGTETDLSRLQFRLQALSPVEEPEPASIETRYHVELLRRRMRDHWTNVLGGFDNSKKYDLLRSLLHLPSGSDSASQGHWQAQFPLLIESKEEAYDLPFWMDLASHALGRRPEAGILFWNRWSSQVKPLLLISLERPLPQLLLSLIRPEGRPNRLFENDDGGQLTEAGRALLDDGDVTLEAFLHRVSGLRAEGS
jgi:type VI secretion system protein ImpM